MFTIKITRFSYDGDGIRYGGVFDSEDAAGRAAVKMMDSGLYGDSLYDFDTVPIPDGVTPGRLAPEYLS